MELVTDRTEADVLLENDKGTYNYEDLNRVENAVAELLSCLPRLDIRLDLVTKTDWGIPGDYSQGGWPTAEQMQRYLQNVAQLCDLFELSSAGLPVTMAKLSWEGANAIEKTLGAVYNTVTGIINSFQYSGELFAGEE